MRARRQALRWGARPARARTPVRAQALSRRHSTIGAQDYESPPPAAITSRMNDSGMSTGSDSIPA